LRTIQLNYQKTTSQIQIELDVLITTGWIGFGLSPDEKMVESGVCMGYFKKDGTVS